MPFVLKRKALRGKRSFEINRFSASVFFKKNNKKTPTNPAALTSDVRDALLIELRLECAPSSLSQGQIIYHPAVVKVTLFIGRSDPSPAIGEPPGPGCTDKTSCRQGDALAEGPVNKADGFHYTVFLLRVLSGAQPGAPNRAALSRLSPNLSWGFLNSFIYLFIFTSHPLRGELCAGVTHNLLPPASLPGSPLLSLRSRTASSFLPNSEHMFEPSNKCSYPSCSFC